MNQYELAMQPVSPSRPLQKHQASERHFQGIPGVEVTASGHLWATWYAGGVNEGPDNYVVLAASSDGGKSWTEPIQVIDPPGNVRAFDPTLWIDPLGRLWWFWAQCYSKVDGNINDGRSGVWAVIADNPDEPVWGAPLRVANGVMMNKPTVLSNGDWAFPTAVWNNLGGAECPPELLDEKLSNLTISSDQGRTFQRRGGADIPFRCYDEHMVVELQNQRLWMLVRTNYGIGQSFSSDDGKTWTPGCDSLLGGPNSRFFLRRLQSGNLLLINHIVDVNCPFCRKQLTAYLSKDDGKTWLGGLCLDEREGVSYPDGKQDNDGNIWIIYDHERYNGGNILLARFREEDIFAGKCTSPDAKLRIPVSSYPVSQ